MPESVLHAEKGLRLKTAMVKIHVYVDQEGQYDNFFNFISNVLLACLRYFATSYNLFILSCIAQYIVLQCSAVSCSVSLACPALSLKVCPE